MRRLFSEAEHARMTDEIIELLSDSMNDEAAKPPVRLLSPSALLASLSDEATTTFVKDIFA